MATTFAGGSTLNSLDAVFKERYLSRPIADLCIEDMPLWGLLPRETDLSGADQSTRALSIPLLYARPPGISGKLSTAQTRAGNSSSSTARWTINTFQLFGVVQIDNESIERSKGKEGAFVDIKMLEVDEMHKALSHFLHVMSYGDGSGTLAQVGNSTQQSSFATSVCILLNSEDATKIEVGYELVVSQNSGGTTRAFGSGAHGLYVIAVDRDGGTFTVGTVAGVAVNLSDSTDGCPTISNNDYISLRDTTSSVIQGVQTYVPQVAPTSGSLNGVAQYKDPVRLAGSRFNASSYGIEEGILRGLTKHARNGGHAKQAFINYKHFADIAMSVVNRGIAEMVEVGPDESPNIGYEALRITGPKGSVDIIPDYACPSTLCFATDVDKWLVVSVGEPVHVLGGDGLEFLRLSSTDGVECRIGGYTNMVPLAPVDSSNILLAS